MYFQTQAKLVHQVNLQQQHMLQQQQQKHEVDRLRNYLSMSPSAPFPSQSPILAPPSPRPFPSSRPVPPLIQSPIITRADESERRELSGILEDQQLADSDSEADNGQWVALCESD